MPFVSKKFVEAMQFYGCAESYKRRGVHPKGSPVRYEASPIVRDHGGRARAALAEIQRRPIFTRIRRLFRRDRADVGPRVITVPGPLIPGEVVELPGFATCEQPPFTFGSNGQVAISGCVVADAPSLTDTREA